MICIRICLKTFGLLRLNQYGGLHLLRLLSLYCDCRLHWLFSLYNFKGCPHLVARFGTYIQKCRESYRIHIGCDGNLDILR
jgi:hypothetical protein